jgi:hypothetical protein
MDFSPLVKPIYNKVSQKFWVDELPIIFIKFSQIYSSENCPIKVILIGYVNQAQ